MTEFITRNYGNKDFEIIIKTDSKEHYKETEDFARRLIDHAKPMTDADRIRAMSDEELARTLAYFEYQTASRVLAIVGVDLPEYDFEVAAKELLEQLQQPAEEVDSNV